MVDEAHRQLLRAPTSAALIELRYRALAVQHTAFVEAHETEAAAPSPATPTAPSPAAPPVTSPATPVVPAVLLQTPPLPDVPHTVATLVDVQLQTTGEVECVMAFDGFAVTAESTTLPSAATSAVRERPDQRWKRKVCEEQLELSRAEINSMSGVAMRAFLNAMGIKISRDEKSNDSRLRELLRTEMDRRGLHVWSYDSSVPVASKRRR